MHPAHQGLDAYQHTGIQVDLWLVEEDQFVGVDGMARLTDFGIAKAATHSSAFYRVRGKVGYMSPEQARGEPVDARADLYALGLLLKEALAGPTKHQGEKAARSLRQLNPEVSLGLADIVEKCVAPRPADRYPDAAALAEDLRRQGYTVTGGT